MHPNPSRRAFLRGSLSSAALVALGPTVPQFLLAASARAAEAGGESVLVVIQLSGGNDGLNTVIPYAHDVYRRSRPLLGIPAAKVRKIDDFVGLHPSMEGFSKLLEDGHLGIVQGVGYPKPNRSHFSSMDIWQSGRRQIAEEQVSYRATGWLGRCLDTQAANQGVAAHAGHDVPGLHLGSGSGRLPLALIGQNVRVPSVQSLDAFKLEDGGDSRLRRAIQKAVEAPRDPNDELTAFICRGTRSALESSRQVQEAVRRYQTDVKYPDTGLARRLKTVAQLIDAGLGARVYYLDLDGFDTHANQAAAHAELLAELSGGVASFVNDLTRHGHGKRVLVMTFSEFGRRVRENASQGTDHGAAAPMFLAGGRVRPGLLSKHPSMTDLDEGDLRLTTDFRSVYAGVLEYWLGVPSEPVLGEKFNSLNVVLS